MFSQMNFIEGQNALYVKRTLTRVNVRLSKSFEEEAEVLLTKNNGIAVYRSNNDAPKAEQYEQI